MTRMIETPVRTIPGTLINAHKPLNILLIGAGGNGSEFLDAMVRLHSALLALGGKGLNITVMDDDTVSDSNIVRQRFWPHMVGQNKAVALVHQINLMMGTNWSAIPVRFSETTAPCERFDLVVTAVDNLDARRSVIAYFDPNGNPEYEWRRRPETFWLDMGVSKDSGQVFFGRFGDNQLTDQWPTAVAHFPEILTREDDDTPSCSTAESLAKQDLMINNAVSGAAANLLWKLLREGKLAFNGITVDLSTGHTRPVAFLPEATKHRD